MYIYMIAQQLSPPGPGEDRFYKLGRELSARGHEVTVLTTKNGLNLELGKNRLGLVQKDGLGIVAFNVALEPGMSRLKKLVSWLRFARLVEQQGRVLPRPELILAASPPLTVALPAMRLKEYFKAPLVMEVRELWPDVPVERGRVKNSLAVRALSRLEEQAYEKADRIVAGDEGSAPVIKERLAEPAKVMSFGGGSTEKEISASYDSILHGLYNER